MSTLNEEIHKQISALARFALPVGTKVIRGRQGKPAPAGRHLVILPIHTMETNGQADERLTPEGLVKRFDWVGEVDIREMDGDGDWLRLLIEATESEEVKTYLTTASFLSHTTIQDLSFQEGDKWILEARVGMRMAIKTQRVEAIVPIETIGIQGTVGGFEITADIPA